MIIPIIMCGGSGTRLWPASREAMPKQFMPMFGRKSTFQDTLARLKVSDLFDQPIVITNERFRFVAAEQARNIGVSCDIVLEPEARDSAAAVAVAAQQANNRTPNAIALVLAADHSVTNVPAFHETCRKAEVVAEQNHIVTFGIEPLHPATGYGYLQPGDSISGTKAFVLDRFVEKPDQATAEKYVKEGFLWNSGNFMFRTDVMLNEIHTHAPEIGAAALAALEHAQRDADFVRLSHEHFAQAPKISIDYAVMEKTDHAAVIPASFGWSDVGSWDAVWALSDQDSDGNALSGNVVCLDTKNSLVRGHDTIVTAVSGLENVVVVTTDDAVLVTTREKSENVKQVIAELTAHNS